jgi:stage II sporulation protein E
VAIRRRRRGVAAPLLSWIGEHGAGEVLFFLGGAMASRAVLFGDILPFGPAFLLVAIGMGRQGALWALPVALGLISRGFGYEMLPAWIAAIAVFIGAMLVRNGSVHIPKRKLALWGGIAVGVVYWVVLWLMEGPTLYGMCRALLGAITAIAMAMAFSEAYEYCMQPAGRNFLSREEWVGLGLTAAACVMGVQGVQIGGVSVGHVAGYWAVMLAAALAGSGTGAVAGCLVGLGMNGGTEWMPLVIATLGGLAGGAFNKAYRWWTGACMAAAALLVPLMIDGVGRWMILLEVGLAWVFLWMVPRRWITAGRRLLDRSFAVSAWRENRLTSLGQWGAERMEQLAGVFSEVAGVFSEAAAGREAASYTSAVELAAHRVCEGCLLYKNCWEREFYRTYQQFMRMCRQAAEGKMPAKVGFKCIHDKELLKTMVLMAPFQQSQLLWEKRIQECGTVVAEQLASAASVMERAKTSFSLTWRFQVDIEDTLRRELDRLGIRAREVIAAKDDRGRPVIELWVSACGGERQCEKTIRQMVSDVCGQNMTAQYGRCPAQREAWCHLKYLPLVRYDVVTAVARFMGKPGEASGDSYSFGQVDEHRFVMALCDGMGAGERAARESARTLSLMEQFMEAGFDTDFAIRTINTLLSLRQDEMYSTLDLCVMDMESGEAEFIKVGAPPSFIKHKDGVEMVCSESLPIGIVQEAAMERATVKLRPDDMVVMVTDGVLDCAGQGTGREESLTGVLAGIHTRNPQEMADVLLKTFSIPKSGRHDDRTVLAGRIWDRRSADGGLHRGRKRNTM